MFKEPIIICAGGNSISEGIEKGLFDFLEDNYTIGLNYFNFYGCPTTITTFCDWKFYYTNLDWLKDAPLIIGKDDPQLHRLKCIEGNTILLPKNKEYQGLNSLKNGLYHSHLNGLFSISLAVGLGFKNIYLLGYDAKEINGRTHFYQDKLDLTNKAVAQKYYGIGKLNEKYKTSSYNNVDKMNSVWFKPFENDKSLRIKNVSLESNINNFPKISYEQLFTEIQSFKINQVIGRSNVLNLIK